MRRVTVECVGISRLLMARMTDETLEELRTGVRRPVQKDRPPEEQAREKLYTDASDPEKIVIPAEMLFACLREAGKGVKYESRKTVTKGDGTTILPAVLMILEPEVPLVHGGWVVDKRRGQMKQGMKTTAVCVVRPRFDSWRFTFTFDLDDKVLGEEAAKQLVAHAGSRQGIGSFRPNKSGSFGRFAIAKWESVALKDEVAAAA